MVSWETKLSSSDSDKDARSRRRKPRVRKPLDAVTLRDLALSYVARFATSGAKLEAYLHRKIRERGVAGGDDADDGEAPQLDVNGIVEQMIDLGYVDDEAYAKARSRDLMARGFGARRVNQALYAAGIDESIRGDQEPSQAAARRAVILLARKRGFGPFSRKDVDPKSRDKHIAAMLRAGHDFAAARAIVDAESQEEIEEWLAEAEEEESGETGLW